MLVTFASEIGGVGVLCTALLEKQERGESPVVRGLTAKLPCGEYLGISSLAEIGLDGIILVSDRLRHEALLQAWRDAKIETPPLRTVTLDNVTWVQTKSANGLHWTMLL